MARENDKDPIVHPGILKPIYDRLEYLEKRVALIEGTLKQFMDIVITSGVLKGR